MNNAGVANPMEALPYLIMIFLPTIFYIIKSSLPLFDALNIESSKSQVLYEQKISHKPQRKSITKNVKPKPKPKPVKQVVEIQATNNDLIVNCISALVKLGFKKADAQKMIKKTCKTRYYRDESELLKDAFKCVL
jgi:hypothetical protein